jgi:hypothetical protein
MRLVFEWDVDPDLVSSDLQHLEEVRPIYDLWECRAYDLDSDAEDENGSLCIAVLGGCDFGPDFGPHAISDDKERDAFEAMCAAQVTDVAGVLTR